MRNKYSTQDYQHGSMARILGKDLPISTKKSIELASFLRNKPTNRAVYLLHQILEKKIAVPFKRFKREVPHRPGSIGPGKYPMHVSKEFLRLIKELESNAQNKGLDSNNLILKNIIVNHASRPWHFGRQRRIKMKRTHIEMIAVEKKAKQADKKPVEKKDVREGKK